MMLLFQVFLSVVIIVIIIIIIVIALQIRKNPFRNNSRVKNFQRNYLESEKFFSKFSYFS